MAISVLTKEDLNEFKTTLLKDIEYLLENQSSHVTKKWLRTSEVTEIIGISQTKILRLRKNGTFSYSKVGGIVFYDYDQIMKVFEKNKVKTIL